MSKDITNNSLTMSTTLFYIHDPMCSWCWGFRPVLKTLLLQLPEGIKVQRLLGGLAPDSDQPMPLPMQQHLTSVWRTIQQRIPGTEFNYDFWQHCQPRRSTYAACRAVIAARQQAPDNDQLSYDERMTEAIQRAYYQQAKNPSDDAVLIDLAEQQGLDSERFAEALNAPATQQILLQEIALIGRLGAAGFPSLVLWNKESNQALLIAVDYLQAETMLASIDQARMN